MFQWKLPPSGFCPENFLFFSQCPIKKFQIISSFPFLLSQKILFYSHCCCQWRKFVFENIKNVPDVWHENQQRCNVAFHFQFSKISRRDFFDLFHQKSKFSSRLFPFFSLFADRTDKPECRKCAKALQELENIDDEADQLGIGFVKIHDEKLADEYNLGELPRLVYYRHKTPIIYESKFYAKKRKFTLI